MPWCGCQVCGDWFQHMRQLLLQTLHRYGSASACYALTQARLVDALNAAATGDRPQPLLEQALQTLQRKKQEGNYRRESVLSPSSSISSPPSGLPAVVFREELGVRMGRKKFSSRSILGPMNLCHCMKGFVFHFGKPSEV